MGGADPIDDRWIHLREWIHWRTLCCFFLLCRQYDEIMETNYPMVKTRASRCFLGRPLGFLILFLYSSMYLFSSCRLMRSHSAT